MWRRVYAAGAIVWATLLPVATWLASAGHASPSSYALPLAVYGIGSVICHQRPERSFHLWAMQMPVCARCTGVYFSGAIAAWCARLKPRATENAAKGHERMWLILAAIPTAATLAYEWTTGVMPANWIRAAAGVALGAAVSWAVVRPAAESPEVN